MAIDLRAATSRSVHSIDAGRELAQTLAGVNPKAVLLFASVEHDQPALLAGLRDGLGAGVPLLGCSTQGVTSRGSSVEGGYFAAAIAFGGDFRAAVARADEVQHAPREKGRALAQVLSAQLPTARLALLFFDPMGGIDTPELLAGMQEHLRCPITGGAASQPWGSMVTTYQYFGEQVFSHGAVALALDGPFEPAFAATHGTEPIGLDLVVTRSEGTELLEIDGRPAADVWKEALALPTADVSQMAALAIGIENDRASTPELGAYRVLAPARFDPKTGGFSVLSVVPPGTLVSMHYRTVASVREGTRKMARELTQRLGGRRIAAVLGFECGARTAPFLGREDAAAENLELQRDLAPQAEWLGMLAWGELLPLSAGTQVVNYTYPLVCFLAE